MKTKDKDITPEYRFYLAQEALWKYCPEHFVATNSSLEDAFSKDTWKLYSEMLAVLVDYANAKHELEKQNES